MINIIADEKIPFLKGVLEPYARVSYLNGLDITPAAVADADALLVRTRTRCDESLLCGSRVKFIATATIGYDHIDTAFCDASSICWVNAPGCNAASVQQYIASALAHIALTSGQALSGKTIGIIGAGHVGQKVEALASCLGMRLLVNDPPRARNEGKDKFVGLEGLLAASDFITLHVPLTVSGEDQTLHLINRDTLPMVKKGAWLINTSRGEVVDQSVLKSTIHDGKFAGVVLDVWENEPGVDTELLKMVSIATPHIAGYSVDGKINGTTHVIRSLAQYFQLPLEAWKPSAIPTPQNVEIELDCAGKSTEMTVLQAIIATYNVVDDDFRFRSDPGSFENLRNTYPARREFPAFKIRMVNGNDNISMLLLSLGFQVI